MNKRLTNEEFLKRLHKVHPGYTALSKYQKASVKVTIKCDKGHVFKELALLVVMINALLATFCDVICALD